MLTVHVHVRSCRHAVEKRWRQPLTEDSEQCVGSGSALTVTGYTGIAALVGGEETGNGQNSGGGDGNAAIAG